MTRGSLSFLGCDFVGRQLNSRTAELNMFLITVEVQLLVTLFRTQTRERRTDKCPAVQRIKDLPSRVILASMVSYGGM